MKTTALLVAGLMSLPGSVVAGQGASPEPGTIANAAEILRSGQLIRLDTTVRGRLEGSFVSRENAALAILADNQPMQVALQDVERLWVRGRAVKRGALVGIIVGVVAGAAAGLFIGEVICDGPDCQAPNAEAMATLGLLGGAGGAAGGALVGSAIPWWHQRFP